MHILILGANGFIGSAVARLLIVRGHRVTALARDTAAAGRRLPSAQWLRADIARLSRPGEWTPLLAGIDMVVNCAGALQDGARDDVRSVQDTAMQALYAAASSLPVQLIVQISARTDGAAAETAFLSSKRRADNGLKNSGIPFVILRPAMVVGRNAHGGSALLRALAAFPLATPLVHGDAQLQFAALDDVAELVVDAVEGRIDTGSDLGIAADPVMTLQHAVAIHRAWLGLPPARPSSVPAIIARAVSTAADMLGHLGWRSPLRSTAMTAAAGGITASGGDRAARPLMSLEATLATHPAGVQDLWFARLYLLKPVVLATLSLFWILSGMIALYRIEFSAEFLERAGFGPGLAKTIAIATSLLDIALGMGVAVRRFAAPALLGMVGVSLAYLLAATALAPALWADPLGPLVKVLPGVTLALIARAILEER